MLNNQGQCSQEMCQSANCARLQSFSSMVNVQIAFSVVVALVGVMTVAIAYILNLNRI